MSSRNREGNDQLISSLVFGVRSVNTWHIQESENIEWFPLWSSLALTVSEMGTIGGSWEEQ